MRFARRAGHAEARRVDPAARAARHLSALERGVIDATEFAMPDMDINLGFYQVAKYNYYPGWHQPASVGELLMNKTAFEALLKAYQAMLEAVRLEHPRHLREVRGDEPARDERDAGEIRSGERRWTDEELAAFEQAWDEVLAEQSAADPTFKKVADSYLAFRKVYKGGATRRRSRRPI